MTDHGSELFAIFRRSLRGHAKGLHQYLGILDALGDPRDQRGNSQIVFADFERPEPLIHGVGTHMGAGDLPGEQIFTVPSVLEARMFASTFEPTSQHLRGAVIQVDPVLGELDLISLVHGPYLREFELHALVYWLHIQEGEAV